VLAWLSAWSEVQTCIWPSWCHCHSLSLASVKSRLLLPFWYRLTQVVTDKRLLNWCVCVWLAIQQNIWSTVVRATLKYDDPRFKMLHSGCSLVRHFQPLVVHSISMSTHYHASSVYCSKWLSLLHSVDNFAITNKQSFNLCNWKQGFLKIVGKE